MSSSNLTDIETTIASLIGELLGKGDLAADTNFFSAGGNSITAMALISEVYSRFGTMVPMHLFLKSPNALSLAKFVSNVVDPEAASTSRRQETVASYQQRQMWISESVAREMSGAFVLCSQITLKGDTSVARLSETWRVLQEEHPSLLSRFEVRDDDLHVAQATEPAPLQVIEWSETSTDAEILRNLVSEIGPIDSGELVRAAVAMPEVGEARLYLAIHHVLVDATSVEIIFRDFAHHHADGGRRPLRPSYQDYTALQTAKWPQAESSIGRAVELLQPLPAPVRFPARQGPRRSFDGEHLEREISVALWNRIQERAASRGETPFTLLVGAVSVVLAEIASASSVVVGIPVSNRHEFGGFDKTVGNFANVMPVRIPIDLALTTEAFLNRVRRRFNDSYEAEAVPFMLLANRLRATRSRDVNPVHQVLVGLHREVHPIKNSSGTWTLERAEPTKSLLDLQVEFEQSEQRLSVVWRYDPASVDSDQVKSMDSFLDHCLDSLVERPVDTLDSVLHPFRRSTLSGRTPEQDRATVVERFLLHASRRPERVALESPAEGVRLSYGQLASRAHSLAAALIRGGLVRDMPVLVMLDADNRSRSFLPEAILAIWIAGGVFVPIDDELPEQTLFDLQGRLGASMMLSEADEKASLLHLDLIRPSSIEVDPKIFGKKELGVDVGGLAYVMFTSGSTGVPKGVVVDHQSLARRFEGFADHIPTEDLRMLAHTASTFDPSLVELLFPLAFGGAVVVTPTLANDPNEVVAVIESGAVTVVEATPSGWQMIFEMSLSKFALDQALVAGAAVSQDVLHGMWAVARDTINFYGPTEGTTMCTGGKLTRGHEGVHAGRPFVAVELAILTNEKRVTPLGVEGDVWIFGEGIAEGYLGDSLRDVRMELATIPIDGRVVTAYNTGDRGRVNFEGNLELAGRADDQVKVRGHRVQLSAVENEINRLPGVRASAVLPVGQSNPGVHLEAFVVKRDASGDEGDFAQQLESSLPTYMIPSAFHLVSALPVTTRGKIDRQELGRSVVRRSQSVSTAWSSDAREVASFWSDVLGSPPTGLDQGFFAAGGTSLQAVRLLGRVNSRWGSLITMRAFYNDATVQRILDILNLNEQAETSAS